jgi:superoxide reductase
METAMFKDRFQSADWKTEKHVPVIEAPDKVKMGDMFTIRAVVGKEIAHPNTTQHHIAWIEIYFHPANEKFPYQIARIDFLAHGSSAQGADTSSVYTAPDVQINFRTDKPGTIFASSYCNIHGLWQNAKELQVA